MVFSMSWLIVTSNSLSGHLSSMGLSRDLGARGGFVHWLSSLIS